MFIFSVASILTAYFLAGDVHSFVYESLVIIHSSSE